MLCLLCAEAAGGQAERALPAAAAIELARAFASVHQDLSDNTPGSQAHTPGGRAPLWWAFGHSQGINAGDALFALARLTIMGLEDHGLPATTIMEAAQMLDGACLTLCEHRYRAIQQEASGVPSAAQHLEMLAGTTGILAGCGASLGALAATASAGVTKALGRYGQAAGVAWALRQEADAMLSHGSRQGLMDALDQPRSLALLHAMETATGEARARLESAMRRDRMLTDQDLDSLARLLEALGARPYAEAQADRYLNAAEAALAQSGLASAALEPLRTYARGLAGRGGGGLVL
jgi:geranylgeranyl diphosphate synthase type I